MTEVLGLAECPHCATSLRGPKPSQPTNVQCVRCEQTFLLSPGDVALDTVPGLEPDADYPIGRCPFCEGKIRIPNLSAIYRCGHCGESFYVPPEALDDIAPTQEAVREDDAQVQRVYAAPPAAPAVPPASSARDEAEPDQESIAPQGSRLKLWVARIALVGLTFLCFPLVLVGQELIATILPVTSDWGGAVALVLGLAALGMVMMLWEAANKRYAPDKPFTFYTGLLFPIGILLRSPKSEGMREFATVQHCLGVEPGRFVVGFRSHQAPDIPIDTMVVEDHVAFADLRHIVVNVNSDDEIQNSAVGDALVDGFARAVSRFKLETKTVGAEIHLLVERENDKVETFVFGIPADFSASKIQLLAGLIGAAGSASGDGGEAPAGDDGVSVLGAAEAYKTIASVLRIDDVSTILAEGVVGLGGVAGFVGRLGSASQLTNKNASVAAALIASAIQQYAPHVQVSRN